MDTKQQTSRICRPPFFQILLPALTVPALLLAGCGQPKLESRWCDRQIVVDGDHTEWEGAVTYVEDVDAVIGLLNDGTHLYLCLASIDRDVKTQVLGRGLTLWIDPEGGKGRVLGIRFPLGVRGRGLPTGSREERPDPDTMMALSAESEPEIEIITGGDLSTRMFLAQAVGIDLDVGLTKGALVYEARIPLLSTDGGFAIGAGPGSVVGIGLTTPKIDREITQERMSRQGPPGGRGGGKGGGGRRGGMGGGMMGGGRRPSMPEPLDIWVTVKIAVSTEGQPGT